MMALFPTLTDAIWRRALRRARGERNQVAEQIRAMSEEKLIPRVPDFSDITLTQSVTQHVHSAWFTYDWKKYNPDPHCTIGSHFHWVRERSVAAFAAAIGISTNEVMVTERKDPATGELQWRCGSKYPVRLLVPTPKRIEPTGERPAIDI